MNKPKINWETIRKNKKLKIYIFEEKKDGEV